MPEKYQFAFFRQAQTEITKAATNFKKSAAKFAYAQPLFNNHGLVIWMTHGTCSSFELLADESRDLYEAEKMRKFTKWQLFSLKMTTFVRLEQKCKFAYHKQQLFPSQLEINHVIHQPTAQSLNKWSGSEWPMAFSLLCQILGMSYLVDDIHLYSDYTLLVIHYTDETNCYLVYLLLSSRIKLQKAS
jgi:hypothetical protein